MSKCGCIEGKYQCGECQRKDYKRAGYSLSPSDLAYDEFVTRVRFDEDEDEGDDIVTLNVRGVVGDGLVEVDHFITTSFNYPNQLWARTSKGTRKHHICVACGLEIAKGQLAYRPVGNTENRASRAHVFCVETQLK